MRFLVLLLMFLLTACGGGGSGGGALDNTDTSEIPNDPVAAATFEIVDTAQSACYDDTGSVITCPSFGVAYYGQDAQYNGTQPSYTDNNDGTITDNVTGLVWQKTPDEKMTWSAAFSTVAALTLGGYTDWRVPTIKELYSLMDFRGDSGTSEVNATPYIDTSYFDFSYGDTTIERYIDSQFLTSTEYVSTTMNSDATVFGVNHADGRIKGYPKFTPGTNSEKPYYFRFVRGALGYGVSSFIDNGDETISDETTGLEWMKNDSGTYNWLEALAWCEALTLAGHSDWRLPNAKELQALVDYSRSPDTTNSPAIDPIFNTTQISVATTNNYPYVWTSTTHVEAPTGGNFAVYIAFGEALGFMEMPPGSGQYELMDVHGAGAQRSDPKSGDPANYPNGKGPQGDVISIYNYVRCVRD